MRLERSHGVRESKPAAYFSTCSKLAVERNGRLLLILCGGEWFLGYTDSYLSSLSATTYGLLLIHTH